MVLISFHLLPLYSVFSESHRKTPGKGKRRVFPIQTEPEEREKKNKKPAKICAVLASTPSSAGHKKKTDVAPIHCGNPSYFSHASPPYPKRKAASPTTT